MSLQRIILPPAPPSTWWKMNYDWRGHTSWRYNWYLLFPTTSPSPLAELPAFWQDRMQTLPGEKKKATYTLENNLQRRECSQQPPTNLFSRQRIQVGWSQGHHFPHSTFLVSILMGEGHPCQKPGYMVLWEDCWRKNQVGPLWKALLSTKHPFLKKKWAPGWA